MQDLGKTHPKLEEIVRREGCFIAALYDDLTGKEFIVIDYTRKAPTEDLEGYMVMALYLFNQIIHQPCPGYPL